MGRDHEDVFAGAREGRAVARFRWGGAPGGGVAIGETALVAQGRPRAPGYGARSVGTGTDGCRDGEQNWPGAVLSGLPCGLGMGIRDGEKSYGPVVAIMVIPSSLRVGGVRGAGGEIRSGGN